MNQIRKKRILLILLVLLGVGVSAGLTLYALRQNINLYFTPSQIHFSAHQHLKSLRLGGMVKKNSVVKNADNLDMQFVITDFQAEIVVKYSGVLPALFKEGQGVIADGHFEENGIFVATTILAKHDEKYMPPNLSAKQSALSSRRRPASSVIISRLDPGLRRDDNSGNLRRDDNSGNLRRDDNSGNLRRDGNSGNLCRDDNYGNLGWNDNDASTYL